MRNPLVWVWALFFLGSFAYLALIAGSLPDQLAVHFDASGHPNGFQAKDAFIATFPIFVFVMNIPLAAIYFFIDRVPPQMIHMPKKEYWFSKPELITLLHEKLRMVMGLVGIVCNFALLFTVQVIYQANASNPAFAVPLNGGVFVILTLAVLLIGAVFIILKPPAEG
jgi:uncharacterized membrane protein